MDDFNWFCNAVRNNILFSFSRWGDGEWNCLLGKSGQNCDGHKYFPEMGKHLRMVLESSPEYILGLQPLANKLAPIQIKEYTDKYNLNWINSDVFHTANIKGYITDFFDVLQNRKVLIVGPEHLKKNDLFDYKFYQIPSRNCWTNYSVIKNDLKVMIDKENVVLFCASMMTNVLIDDLHGKGTLIDFGSVLDPFVGVMSRSYHRRLNIEK